MKSFFLIPNQFIKQASEETLLDKLLPSAPSTEAPQINQPTPKDEHSLLSKSLYALGGTLGGGIAGIRVGDSFNDKQLKALDRYRDRYSRFVKKYEDMINEPYTSTGNWSRRADLEEAIHASPPMRKLERLDSKNMKLGVALSAVIDKRVNTGLRIGALLGLGTGVAAPSLIEKFKEKYNTIKQASDGMLSKLIQAKEMSDSEDYVSKYNLMNKLLKEYPDEFYVDQDHPDYPGIVHAPTGFRMHLPRQATYGISKKAEENNEPYKLYYFEGRNTGIAARSEEEARAKKKRGGDKLVAVRTPTESEVRLMEFGKWVRTRYDGKPPGKSEVEGIGMGPPLKKKANKKKVPEHILKLIFKGDSKALSEMGKLGNKAKMDLKRSKAMMDYTKMQKHLEHPDTKHFLSWDDSTDFTKYSSFMEKSAVLGFKGLTGNTGPIKALLRDLKSKNIPVTRVKPEAVAARSPLTEHLPVGGSIYSRGSWSDAIDGFRGAELKIGKGLPRKNYEFKELPDGTFQTKTWDNIKGGTNPSPIASLFHEAGHDMHYRVARKLNFANNNKHLGHYGTHSTYTDDLLKEIGANNSALQFLRRNNASPQAMAYYKGARTPSFKTYLDAIPADYSHSIVDKVRSLAPGGYTKDLIMRSVLP